MKRALRRFIVLFAPAALIAVSALSGCVGTSPSPAGEDPQLVSPSPSQDTSPALSPSADIQPTGLGETEFYFEATGPDGGREQWLIRTGEATVGAALLELGLIKGDVSSFGLYVTEVNGIVADYAADQAYWAFYVDGDYAVSGADTTAIEPGKTYAFVYTK
ncbi:MAG: DUF4430 domain-containing protein [Oscillospiraceae bacterium]|jgi:hypothetical protein|nr:DUF4430 domain-containing protein [Oscillospiraceae bacterium]